MAGIMWKPIDRGIDREPESLIVLVGERVHKARKATGYSRRLLSEKSGVSQRYIAQLESGGGNISIALLNRVANALHVRMEHLVGEDDPWESDVAQISGLYRHANEQQQAQIREILAAPGTGYSAHQRIALIGLRGAGKSTLGQLVAEDLEAPFVELNRCIERQSGIAIAEVMALYGPEGYRQLEHRAVVRAAEENQKMVLAVAGGVVSVPETYEFLLQNFHTIWIKASPQEHMDRVRSQGDERPMADNPKAMDELRAILTRREMDYGRADAVLDTSGKTIAGSKKELITIIRENGYVGTI